jgi:hypothetical protein
VPFTEVPTVAGGGCRVRRHTWDIKLFFSYPLKALLGAGSAKWTLAKY